MSRIQFDFGALRLLPGELALLGVKRPLLVTDPGVRSAGLVERVLATLDGVRPPVFEDTTSNPTEAAAEAAMALHRAHGCDGVVALGGGSAIDLAKAVALSVLILPFGWVSPTWQGGLGLAAIGVISGLGQILWTQAFRLVPAAILAPFSYTSMIWSIGLGFLIWGDMPTAVLIGGACVVAMSGLYILYRETIRRQSQRPVLAAAAGDD